MLAKLIKHSVAACAAFLFLGVGSAAAIDVAGFNEQKIEQAASDCNADAQCRAASAKYLREHPPRESGGAGDWIFMGCLLAGLVWFFGLGGRSKEKQKPPFEKLEALSPEAQKLAAEREKIAPSEPETIYIGYGDAPEVAESAIARISRLRAAADKESKQKS